MLGKVAFPRIAEALDKRQKAIEESIDAAERTRVEADELLAEYRERLDGGARPGRRDRRPRAQGRRGGRERDRSPTARAKREEMMEQTRRDIEAETRRAIQEIRNEVADLTVLATEKVTRKTLDRRRPAAARRGGARRARLRRARPASERPLAWRRSPRSTPASLFEVAQGAGQARRGPRAARRSSPTRSSENRDLQVFFFSPYFSTEEKKDGLRPRRRRTPTRSS